MPAYVSPPKECDLCKRTIGEVFYDCSIPYHRGSWANICTICFIQNGCKLGTGYGQEYRKQPNGDYVKVNG